MPESPRETLELMLGHLGFVFRIDESERNGQVVLAVSTRDPGRLIGRDGHTLEDLQCLLNRLVHANEDDHAPQILIEVEGYRLKGGNDPVSRAKQMADRVRRTGKPLRLPRMNSFDRRQIHHAFADDPEIITRSEETDARHKYIVLEPRQPAE